MSKAKLILAVILLLLLSSAAILFAWSRLANAPGSGQNNWLEKKWEIREGDTWQELGRRLSAEKLIRSPLWYKIQLRLRKEPITLKAGSYIWPRFMNTKEIIDYFQIAQPQQTFPVTIPEGLTRRQIALLLEKKGILSAKEFLAESSKTEEYRKKFSLPYPSALNENPSAFTLEGYLFPDTYFLPQTYSAPEMVSLMLETFLKNLNDIAPGWKALKSQTLYEKLILSSIVQKEYRAEAEAPIIASVFQNRLNQGIKLQSCATVVYVLTEELGRPHPNRILFRDLEVDSPYNTYQVQGLPPHPIANMGATALNAAFHQAKTDYLFFVVENVAKGTHKFSASFSDHNAARASYIQNYFNR